MSEFPMFALSEEHQFIREAVREVCEAKVGPHAAGGRRGQASSPRRRTTPCVAADFHAPHIPEEYGGAGADALATAIVIEEVARACASSSLIPAVNKLGTLPLILAGSDVLKKTLPDPGRGRGGDVLLLPLRAGRRLGRGVDEDPGGPGRRPLGAQRRQAVDHQRRRLGVLHGVRRDRPGRQGAGISAFVVEKSDEGVSFGAPEKKLGIKGSPDPRGLPRQRADPGRPDDRRRGHRLRDRDADPGPHPGHHRRAGGRDRAGRAGLRAGGTPRSASSSARRSPSSRACSSCSPTWA